MPDIDQAAEPEGALRSRLDLNKVVPGWCRRITNLQSGSPSLMRWSDKRQIGSGIASLKRD